VSATVDWRELPARGHLLYNSAGLPDARHHDLNYGDLHRHYHADATADGMM